MTSPRRLKDLVSVGPATLRDLENLGITEVEHLIDKDPDELLSDLEQIKGCRIDPCCRDVFQAAIEQARDPHLPAEQCQWFYWSRKRKGKS